MPAPTPRRDRNVYFVGAGLSCALGLPNTPLLIESVLELSKRHNVWGQSEQLPSRLDRAFRFFYPDGKIDGFRPDVVDFFSSLRTFIDVGSGLPGTGFADAPALFRSLKYAIAHLLVERIRQVDEKLRLEHDYLQRMLSPGNVVVTSNWDLVLERYCALHGVPLRHSGSGDSTEVAILKLHGSIDWCRIVDTSRALVGDEYSALTERLFGPHTYRTQLPTGAEELVRVRGLESWNDCWRRIKSRTTELHMVTMVRIKSSELGPLQAVWRDAYAAISRARQLEIVGYSMPPDDVEIRTLIRAGIQRGRPGNVVVRNPAPDVHDRFRSYLDRNIVSEYLPVNAI
jgi:hypothetical protein